MEVAFGAVGAVSLGIQLAGTVKKVQGFLKSIHNAPEQVTALVDDLQQLHMALSQICRFMERQRTLPAMANTNVDIESAFRSCETSIRRMDLTVDKLRGYFDKRGKIRHAWASLKTVLKEEDIEDFRKQIQSRLSTLHVVILLNMSHLQLNQLQISSFNTELMLSHRDVKESQMSSLGNKPTRSSSNTTDMQAMEAIQSTKTCKTTNCRILGFVQIRSHRKSSVGARRLSRETRILFSPPMMKKVFEFYYFESFDHVSRSLNSFPVMRWDSTIFRMCRVGDIVGVQRALSNGEVSPFVRNEIGMTLLHCSSLRANAELCSLLIQIGVDPNLTDINGDMACFSHAFYPSVDTLRVLAAKLEDIAITDLESFARNWQGRPAGAEFMLSHEGVRDELNYNYSTAGKDPFLSMALRHYGTGKKDWAGVIRTRLRAHNGLHAKSFYSRFCNSCDTRASSLLDDIFFWTHDSFEAADMGKMWLNLLFEERYDVISYLEEEMAMRSHQGSIAAGVGHRRASAKLSFHFGEVPSVTWDWWVDPQSLASLARHEFRCMIFPGKCCGERTWHDEWPFCHTTWSEDSEPWDDQTVSEKWLAWQKENKLAKIRYARRGEKKRIKMLRIQGFYRRSRMPGSWVE